MTAILMPRGIRKFSEIGLEAMMFRVSEVLECRFNLHRNKVSKLFTVYNNTSMLFAVKLVYKINDVPYIYQDNTLPNK